jgi:hypothetical protein
MNRIKDQKVQVASLRYKKVGRSEQLPTVREEKVFSDNKVV